MSNQVDRLQQARDLVASFPVAAEASETTVREFGRGLPGTTKWTELFELVDVFNQSLLERFPTIAKVDSVGKTQLGQVLWDILCSVHEESMDQRKQSVREFARTLQRTTEKAERNRAVSVFAKSMQTAEHEDHEGLLYLFEKIVNDMFSPRDASEMVGVMRWDLWHEASALHAYYDSSGFSDFLNSLQADMPAEALKEQANYFAANFTAIRAPTPLDMDDYELLTDQFQHYLKEKFPPNCVGWMVEIMLHALPDLPNLPYDFFEDMLTCRRDLRFEAFLGRLRQTTHTEDKEAMIREYITTFRYLIEPPTDAWMMRDLGPETYRFLCDEIGRQYDLSEEENEDGEDYDEEDEEDETKPAWLRPTFDLPAPIISKEFPFPPEMENSEEFKELVDAGRNLLSLNCNLEELANKYHDIISHRSSLVGEHASSVRRRILLCLHRSEYHLERGGGEYPCFQKVNEAVEHSEAALNRARQTFPQLEQLLIDLETLYPETFETSASRYERAKNRAAFSKLIGSIQSPHLNNIDFSKDVLQTHEERVSLAQLTDLCPICHEEDADAVTTKCCKRTFHVSCLLEWMLARAQNKERSCPMCRVRFDEQDVADALELRTKQLAVL